MSDTLYTSMEVIELLNHAITYRQLDHWCRTGTIYIDGDTAGSGHHRMFTTDDIEALRLFAVRYRQIHEQLESCYDGTMWSKAVNEIRWHRMQAEVAEQASA
jgi:DNA-binding transcriptional MerR regulator